MQGRPGIQKITRANNICTECSDLMEDLMGEYFLRTISDSGETNKRVPEIPGEWKRIHKQLPENKTAQ